MIRRLKYAVGIVIVVLILSLPHVLQAQSGLSLEDLSGTVQELTSDFNVFAREIVRINDRLEAVENAQAALAAETNQVEESGEPCVVSAKEYGHLNSVPRLRTETINGYHSKYGRGMEIFGLYDIFFDPEEGGILKIRYLPYDRDEYVLEIVEKWQRCKFLGFEFKEK